MNYAKEILHVYDIYEIFENYAHPFFTIQTNSARILHISFHFDRVRHNLQISEMPISKFPIIYVTRFGNHCSGSFSSRCLNVTYRFKVSDIGNM